ncbi:biopolymer transporter ExbB [Octadecabacter sp. 1_MG-2023]|uniref:biopolymer transporter ExbB n=1 Tax=unclassified Octadecabacter TaxID=196158 RepID=UPI001C08C326|nr:MULTISPECIES: biopolymer transporter ExbB [unclassified Octadecabacter]MBU2991905.1 biopolymer transporter ExbB [Octadecabacter sp. B2R22]MDO6735879.1 biopolymer transporter ExbB [Octadecabacter sp. 1_MG-2023]
MATGDPKAEPQFSQPWRQIILMLVGLGLVCAGVILAFPRVGPVFLANPYLNGFIFVVFIIGVMSCFWQVWQLIKSVSWIEGFAGENEATQLIQAPGLLAPLATLMRSRGARMNLTSSSSRSILDSVSQRIDEDREITRYIVNTLIFLGLLGTFYGLATTVPALVDTIRSLTPQEGESGADVFVRLQAGLESQLGGMGVAFASSLLGLAGSLVVGLLELFAGHGQNRFYRELEEWMSSITRVGLAAGDEADGETTAMSGVVDHMVDQMERMQDMFAASEASRTEANQRIGALAEVVEILAKNTAGTNATEQLTRVADAQEQLIVALKDTGMEGIDAESRMRLRSIDVGILRILEEMAAGRQEVIHDLRADMAGLTKAVRQGTREARKTNQDGT